MMREEETDSRVGKNQVRERDGRNLREDFGERTCVLLTQHFTEISIMQVRVLVRKPLAFGFGPHHEGVHGTPDPLLTVHTQGIRCWVVMMMQLVLFLRIMSGLRGMRRHDEKSGRRIAGIQNSLISEVHAAAVRRIE